MSREINYDEPIEVTQTQYAFIMHNFSTLVAGRVSENGKHYIKLYNVIKPLHLPTVLRPSIQPGP